MNAETFKQTFLQYHQRLYRLAYRILQNAEDAEDAVQEAYIKLWTKRDECTSLRDTESFAVTVLKNTCLDYLKKRKQEGESSSEYDMNVPSTESLSVKIEHQHTLQLVESLMMNLSKPHQQVMRLKHWGGYSDEEIEQITGLTRGNIKMIISRTRRFIKEQFQKIEEDENRNTYKTIAK